VAFSLRAHGRQPALGRGFAISCSA